MTQASLSPGLDRNLLDQPAGSPGVRTGTGSAATLWLLALTSLTLVFASLVLLGLLAQGTVASTSVGAFANSIAIVTGGLGVVVMGYVLIAAARAGYLRTPRESRPRSASVAPDGLHVAPAVPAGLAYRKRQQRAAEQAERRKQARAIDAVDQERRAPQATASTGTPARVQPRAVAPPPAPARVAPVRPVVAQPAPAKPQPTTAQVRTAPPRSVAPPPTPARVAPARPVPVRPAPARVQPLPAPRPAASPPFLRLSPPRVRPRGQAALLQVGAASVRVPFVPPRTQPLLPGMARVI